MTSIFLIGPMGEAAMIDELTARPNIVLATGGGAILRETNRQHLRNRGHVVLLSVELKEQFRRIGLDSKRPLLNTQDPKARLRTLMEERAPTYKALAHVEIATDSRRMHHVVKKILLHLKSNGLTTQ